MGKFQVGLNLFYPVYYENLEDLSSYMKVVEH